MKTLTLVTVSVFGLLWNCNLRAFASDEANVIRADWLGASVYERVSDGRTRLKSERTPPPRYKGVLVDSVEANSPAAQLGIMPLDLIIAVNGKRFAGAAQLTGLSLKPGEKISILWRRFDGRDWRISRKQDELTKRPDITKRPDRAQQWTAKTSLKKIDSKPYPMLTGEYAHSENATQIQYKAEMGQFALTVSFLAMPDMPKPERLQMRLERKLKGDDLPLFLQSPNLVIDGVEHQFQVGGSGGGGADGRTTEEYWRFELTKYPRSAPLFVAMESLKNGSVGHFRLVGRSSELKVDLSQERLAGIKQLYDAYRALDGDVVLEPKPARNGPSLPKSKEKS